MYKLIIGKPGALILFPLQNALVWIKRLIERARSLVDEDHFNLDKLLNRTEQDLRKVEDKEKELQQVVERK